MGYGSSAELELSSCHTIQSACNVVVHTFDELRRRVLYELNSWKALINASKENREKCRQVNAFYNWLRTAELLKPTKDGGPIKLQGSTELVELLSEDLFQKMLDPPEVVPPTAEEVVAAAETIEEKSTLR